MITVTDEKKLKNQRFNNMKPIIHLKTRWLTILIMSFIFVVFSVGYGKENNASTTIKRSSEVSGYNYFDFTPIDNDTPLSISTVFKKGEAGYDTFRIPAITRTLNGTLLAFAEGRVESTSDNGNIDLVLKRSLDNGVTWEPLNVVHNDRGNTVGNPAPVVIRETGRILLLFTHNLGGDHIGEINEGSSEGARTVWITHSDDDGKSWITPTEITSSVKKSDWLWYATGPGHAIQLTNRSPFPGRIIVPCNHTSGKFNDRYIKNFYFQHLIYSDDLGKSWKIGAYGAGVPAKVNPDESTAAELADGSIYVNSRNQLAGASLNRAFAISINGGKSYENDFDLEPSIIAPVVEGSVLRYSLIEQGAIKNRLLFSAPGDPDQRRELRVRLSTDEAKSWSNGVIIHAGPAAYSDLVITSNSLVGVLFEAGDKSLYERIDFARFGIKWLEEMH